jgi:hypothetical protein
VRKAARGGPLNSVVRHLVVFAEMNYPERYEDLHEELRAFLGAHFSKVQSGLQGDSWFWIFDGAEKVAIDTFSSMKHQVKSERPGPHVQAVVNALRTKYEVRVYEKPMPEPHEDQDA